MKTGFARKALAVALVLCMAFLCAACTKEVTFKDYYKDVDYTDPYPTVNTLVKLDQFTGMNFYGIQDDVVVFRGTDGWLVYNMATETVLLEMAPDTVGDVELFAVNGHAFFAVETYSEQFDAVTEPAPEATAAAAEEPDYEDYYNGYYEGAYEDYYDAFFGVVREYTVKVYNENGTEVASAVGNDVLDAIDWNADLLEFDSLIYRVDQNGNLAQINTNPFFGGIPDFEYKAGDYYYTFDDCTVTVYDSSLNAVFFWEAPWEELEECNIVPLGDNLLVQIAIPLLDSEDDYDCILDEEKYALKSLILDPKNGSVKDVDLDYILMYSDRYGADYSVVAMIENYRVLSASSALKKVRLNEKSGAIAEELFTDIYGYTVPVVQNRYFYYTYSGDMYLIDGAGKTIGKVNELKNLSYSNRNESFFAYGDSLYNYNLEKVFDYGEQELSLYAMLGHSVVFRNKEGRYILYKRTGETKDLDAAAMGMTWNKQFYVMNYEGGYAVYNEDGKLLQSWIDGTQYSTVCTAGGATIIGVVGAEGWEYYKIFDLPETE